MIIIKIEIISSNISTQSEIHTHIFEIIKEINPSLDNYGYKVNCSSLDTTPHHLVQTDTPPVHPRGGIRLNDGEGV